MRLWAAIHLDGLANAKKNSAGGGHRSDFGEVSVWPRLSASLFRHLILVPAKTTKCGPLAHSRRKINSIRLVFELILQQAEFGHMLLPAT